MEFGPLPSKDAVGAILAHSIRLPNRSLKKGRVLSEEDTRALVDADINTVTACRLGPEDVHEDDAADRLAAAACGEGIRRTAAFTGRVNLIAEGDGILLYEPADIMALNAVDEGITLAALPPFSRVSDRQMLATAKIIPFGVPEKSLEHALPTKPLFALRHFKANRFSLIQTVLDSVKPSVLDKTEEILTGRFENLGATASPPLRCAHEVRNLADALSQSLAQKPDAITIVGASAIVDRRDVIPAAIEEIGGRIRHFGMPVDPGNLLLLGEINGTPIIGAPGCVRSPKPNGYDWVLERIAAGLSVDGPSIMAMGSGGLLKEIASRPLPRARAVPSEPETGNRAPRISGLLLAAGQSRRMGVANKLLETVTGAPMVRVCADTMRRSRLDEISVVLGHEAESVRHYLDDAQLRFVENPDYRDGLSASVKAGIAALPDDTDGAIVCLGDMPSLKTDTIDRVLAAFDPLEGRSICVPTYNGKRGNPVLFARRYFQEILALSGDTGAKHLLGLYPEEVAEVAVDDPGILLDIDTPEKLAALRDETQSMSRYSDT